MHTDVLIIGSGLAGLRAAEAAAREGARVTVVGKGTGASPGVMGFNVAMNPEDHTEIYYEDLLRNGSFINNKKLAKILAEDSVKEVANLEGLGLEFDRKADGSYDAFQPLGSTHPRLVHYKALTGIKSLSLIGEDCRKMGVVFEKRIMITQLLRHDNRIVGAVGINLRDGAFVSYHANAVVLTAGGCGAIYPTTTYPKDIVGDGYAMVYRAGAELVDMEFLQFDPCCFVYPESIKGSPIATTMMKEGAVLRNVHGERFMFKYGEKGENVQKDELARAMAIEIAEGRGTEHKGVYFDATMLPRDMVVVNHSIFYDPALKAGVDLMKEPAEVAPAAHTLMGGVKIDESCKSSLDMLFAAGEAAGGIHGANRIGGSAGAEILTFGARAGKYAALSALAKTPLPEKTVEPLIEKERKADSARRERNQGTSDFAEIHNKIQAAMGENVGIIKNNEGLNKACEALESLESRLGSLAVKNAEQLIDLHKLENMITTGKMLARASLARTESRGVHYRSDFPARQDKEWLKNIVIKRVDGEMKMEALDCK
ncbi:MAG: FAD-binding protein [Deltaproteobacteria bacterium]|nr:FAD-binding protein [Deltaproteobacteria bacterium]